MILQALVSYYEALAKQGEISRPGYAPAKVSFALRIDWDGELLGILPLKDEVERGKKKVEIPQTFTVPEPVTRTVGVAANFLCDNGAYLLGAERKGNLERTLQCFDAAKNLHLSILKNVSTPAALAVTAFFQRWEPRNCPEHPVVTPYLEAITAGPNLIFQLPDGTNAQDDPAILSAWDAYRQDIGNSIKMQCLVTGKSDQPIAVLHGKIKGVKDAQSVGASIVSFNAGAYESYGHEERYKQGQGRNSPVSEYAAFAYVTALNHLLSDGKHRCFLGDATVVYWAETGEPQYPDMFSDAVMPDVDAEEKLHAIMERLEKGRSLSEEGIKMDTRFYVLALSPNAARLSIRFFWQDRFGNILNNIRDHYKRLAIIKPSFEKWEYLTLYWLLRETVSPMSQNQDASPLLTGSVLRSVFMGTPYPEALPQSVLTRIRAEREVTRGKAAILKAWLLRNRGKAYETYKEVLTVSLNEQSRNKAYVLGRLFAVLEKAQEEANPGINATIKDRYFPSACAAPVTVFPILLRLSNHYIAKAQYGKALAWQIGELMSKLQVENRPFPARLTLEEQGIFVLGYYHQVQARYQKKAAASTEEANNVMNEEITNTKEEE